MSPDPKELQKWMTPDTSDLRVNRLVSRVRDSSERRAPAWRWVAGAVGVAAVALLAVMLWPRPLAVGTELVASADETVGRFSDGSRVEVSSGSSVRLVTDTSKEVRVELARGRATFEVTKKPGRSFVVKADGVEVRVVGTRFTVSRGADGVTVEVARGIVDVVRADATVRLTAGGRWTEAEAHAAAEPAPEPVQDPELPSAQPAPAEEPAAPEAPEPPVKTSRPSRSKSVGGGGHKSVAAKAPAPAPAEAAATPAAGGGSDVVDRAGPSPAQLFQEALQARREGRSAHAALTFERFLRDFPYDSRVALAAFELGRLRMDQLSDVKGAVEALERAVKLAPDGTFAEDAMSRLVRGYDELGLQRQCLQYREQYLARFKGGAYVKSVTARCAAR